MVDYGGYYCRWYFEYFVQYVIDVEVYVFYVVVWFQVDV